MSEWEVETLRITAFVASDASSEVIWKDFTGEEPDRQLNDKKTSIQEEAGLWNDLFLVLRRQSNRIDLLFSPAPQEASESIQTLQTIGGLDEKTEILQKSISIISDKTSENIVRIALGAVFLQPVESEDAGNSVLACYVPGLVNVDAPGITDLLYQINRPREEEIDDTCYLLNRVSKWSVQSSAPVVLVGGVFQVLSSLPMKHARLELDLSTDAANSQSLPRQHINALFSKLIQFGQEIATKGDVV